MTRSRAFSAVKSYRELAAAPDLAVIAVPPAAVPSVIAEAGAKGTPAAIIITAGLGHGPGSLAEQAEKAARATGMRLVGPNCLGVLVPRAKLNASFAASMPDAGDLALISQSGAIAAGLVEWAATHGIGFSAVVSIGDSIDVDFGDLLDYFALDRGTRAILLYIELIRDARKFMSAARAAARAKPVLVIKSGRNAQGAKAALTHTGALAGSDAVYDAAFRRAGLLRVLDLDELFAAAETLGHLTTLSGKRLAILTNGGGVGVLAVDRLADLGGEAGRHFAGDDAKTRCRFAADLVARQSGRYCRRRRRGALCRGARAIARRREKRRRSGHERADRARIAARCGQEVIAVTEEHRSERVPAKPVFAVWIGGSGTAEEAFDAADIPSYATETDAVGGFMHLVRYRQSRELLMATPPDLPQDFAPDTARCGR